MSNFETRFQMFSTKFLQVLCAAFFFLTLWNSISNLTDSYGIVLKHYTALFLFIFFLIVSAFLVHRYLKNSTFLILLILISFTLRLIWVLNVDSSITSDFGLMYQSAINAAKGDFSFSQSDYFSTWVYQLGFTMYEALIIKLFGEGPIILKLLNILYSVGITVLIYKISSKLFNESVGRISGILYAIFIPSILMSSVLTNEHLATFFFYFGFYLLIIDNPSRRFFWVYVGLLLSLGDILRPLGSLILLAVGIFLFITQFISKERKEKWLTIRKFAGILAVFLFLHFIISQLFIASNITTHALSNRDPLWKFVLGFNYDTAGRYSNADAALVGEYQIGEERATVERQLIKERTTDLGKLWDLFTGKFKIMWAGTDDSTIWSMGHFDKKEIITKINKIEKIFYVGMMFFGAIALISLIRKYPVPSNSGQLLFILLILGYVAVHLLIEIQTRYRYFIIPSFVILQGVGVFTIFQFLSKISQRFTKGINKGSS